MQLAVLFLAAGTTSALVAPVAPTPSTPSGRGCRRRHRRRFLALPPPLHVLDDLFFRDHAQLRHVVARLERVLA